jgi:y4mF family transcriptional regulator
MGTRKTILALFIKEKRKKLNLSQKQLADKAGVGLRFIREMEQGKETLRLDKVNQVLKLFGQEAGPVPINRNKLIYEES